MTKTVHICLDIRGFLKSHMLSGEFDGMFRDDDGRKLTADEAKDMLLDQLVLGRKVLPYGQCEGFSYETGCPGHEDPESSPVVSNSPDSSEPASGT